MEGVHGYKKVKNILEDIAILLMKEKKEELAQVVLRAMAFYGGMPSEFLGESWLSLKAVLEEKTSLSERIVSESRTLSNLIEEGFKKVGRMVR